MTHYYVARKMARGYSTWDRSKPPDKVRPLCTNEWVEVKTDSGNRVIGHTTSLARVTCKRCLKLLIDKREAELSVMKANFEKENGPSVAQMPEANMGTQSTST